MGMDITEKKCLDYFLLGRKCVGISNLQETVCRRLIPCNGNVTTNCSKDCNETLLKFSFVILTIDLVFLMIVLLLILYMVCKACSSRTNVQREVNVWYIRRQYNNFVNFYKASVTFSVYKDITHEYQDLFCTKLFVVYICMFMLNTSALKHVFCFAISFDYGQCVM